MSIHLSDTVTELLNATSLLSWSKEKKEGFKCSATSTVDNINVRNKNVNSMLLRGDTSVEYLQLFKRLGTTVMNPDTRQEQNVITLLLFNACRLFTPWNVT
jgi:hypothetical protein